MNLSKKSKTLKIFSSVIFFLVFAILFFRVASEILARWCCEEDRYGNCIAWCSGVPSDGGEGGVQPPPPPPPPPPDGGGTTPAPPPDDGGGEDISCQGECCSGSDCSGGCVCCGATCDDKWNPQKGTCSAPSVCIGGGGGHDAICDFALAPQMSTARSETWTFTGCSASDGGACQSSWSRSNFKSMFEDRGFVAGGNRCFFGEAKPCLFIGTEYNMPVQCDCCELKQADCDYCEDRGPNCESRCEENFNQNCACWTGDVLFGYNAKCGCVAWRNSNPPGLACEPNCDAACTQYQPFNNSGSDSLRIRAPWPCPDPDAGGAIRIKAPSDYVIKSITFDMQSHLTNGVWQGYHHNANFGVSRGMNFGLDSHIDPRVSHYTKTSSGNFNNQRVDLAGGSKYAFFYLEVTGDCEYNKDDWVEISDIKLEVVKKTEVEGEKVTVINNSLLWYDGVNKNNPDLSTRWPTKTGGWIQLSNNGANWSTYSVNSNWAINWTLPQGPEGRKTVWAHIEGTGTGYANTCAMSIDYRPLTGKIYGKVHQDEYGGCSGEGSLEGWSVTCREYNQTELVPARMETDGIHYTCVDKNGNDQLPQGNYYEIIFTPPEDWRKTDCTRYWIEAEGGPYKLWFYIEKDEEEIPPMYLWQGSQPWFQTKEGDVHAQGRINSRIPLTTSYFSLSDLGNYPGLVSYNSDTPFYFGRGSVSQKGWLVKDGFSVTHRFNNFYSKLGSPEVDNLGTESLEEYINNHSDQEVFYLDGNVTISNEWDEDDFPDDRKAIVLIKGDLEITKEIIVPVGSFFAFIVSGDIKIDGNVGQKPGQQGFDEPDVEGVYITDNNFWTNVGDIESGKQFRGAGIFIANKFELGRDLKEEFNDEYPAELFIARPDLFVNIPEELKTSYFFEQEVAP